MVMAALSTSLSFFASEMQLFITSSSLTTTRTLDRMLQNWWKYCPFGCVIFCPNFVIISSFRWDMSVVTSSSAAWTLLLRHIAWIKEIKIGIFVMEVEEWSWSSKISKSRVTSLFLLGGRSVKKFRDACAATGVARFWEMLIDALELNFGADSLSLLFFFSIATAWLE